MNAPKHVFTFAGVAAFFGGALGYLLFLPPSKERSSLWAAVQVSPAIPLDSLGISSL